MNVDATVRNLLTLARLEPSEAEIQEYLVGYPTVRANLDLIYAMPGLADTEGILVFRPTE